METRIDDDPGLPKGFFDRHAADVAASLIGVEFLLSGVGGIIVETEAYTPTDPASHSFNGKTLRNGAMFGPAGCIYVYRSYGLHWCLNFVCQTGSAVLIRALQPTRGTDLMRKRRSVDKPLLLCSGPGRLCQALAVNGDLDGQSLASAQFSVSLPATPVEIIAGARIGISKAIEVPWRFGLKGSAFLSKKI